MSSPSRVVTTVAVVSAALVALACGTKQSPQSTDPTTAGAGVGIVTGSPTTAAPATSTAPAQSYPAGAREYTEAVLAAWKAKANQTLAGLSTAQVQEQIIEIPMPVNMTWHYGRCEGAAGSTYCFFFNDDGDKFVLQLNNQLLGQAHAGVGVQFGKTEFPAAATAYVKAFVGAWADGNRWRMLVLANQNEVDYFTHYTPPEPTYLTCEDHVAGSTYVRVYNTVGLNYAIQVTNAQLGKSHAIASHAQNPPTACP